MGVLASEASVSPIKGDKASIAQGIAKMIRLWVSEPITPHDQNNTQSIKNDVMVFTPVLIRAIFGCPVLLFKQSSPE